MFEIAIVFVVQLASVVTLSSNVLMYANIVLVKPNLRFELGLSTGDTTLKNDIYGICLVVIDKINY